jgi:tyrosine-protein kinase Etk/Wzc
MTSASAPEEFEEEPSISLWEIATTLGEEKKWIVMITGVITMATTVVSLLLTPMFTAKTTFIVPNPSAGASTAQALANLGGLMGAGGGAAALLSGGKSPDEMYMEFLKSQSILNGLIEEFALQKHYEKKSLEGTQIELKKRTKITPFKKAGLITVAVDDEDPQFAAKLANAYIVNLKKLLETFASTEAQMRKEYYEKELIRAKKDLQGLTDYRDMKVRESVIAVIMNQYEVAVLDSARESLIQVSEKALPPDKRSSPKRTLMVLIAFAVGLFLSILFVLMKSAYQRAQKDPESKMHLEMIRRAWLRR